MLHPLGVSWILRVVAAFALFAVHTICISSVTLTALLSRLLVVAEGPSWAGDTVDVYFAATVAERTT